MAGIVDEYLRESVVAEADESFGWPRFVGCSSGQCQGNPARHMQNDGGWHAMYPSMAWMVGIALIPLAAHGQDKTCMGQGRT
jgi:hypothetical protein